MSWADNLVNIATDELAALRLDNEEWSRNLILRIKTLIHAKTAGDISEDEYDSSIIATNKDIAECIRRNQLLTHELSKRGVE